MVESNQFPRQRNKPMNQYHKKDNRPSDVTDSSGYSSVSSVPSLSIPSLHELNEGVTDSAFTEEIPYQCSKRLRKESIVLMPEKGSADDLVGESHDFDTASQVDTHNSDIPAFDAFGETKRRDVKSYNIEKRFLQLCRLVMYIAIFCVVLGGGVLTKLSVLSLVSNYSQSKGSERTKYAVHLIVIICSYPFLSMMSALFKVLFGRVKSLTRQFIYFLMVIELLQSFGILLFVFKVLPSTTGLAALCLMMSAPVIPSFLSLINAAVLAKGNFRKRGAKLILYIIIFVLQAGSIISFYFLGVLGSDNVTSNEIIWAAPLSIVLISLGWENFTEFKSLKVCKRFKFKTFVNDLQKPREKAHVWTTSCKLLVVAIVTIIAILKPDSFFGILYNVKSELITDKELDNRTSPSAEPIYYKNCSGNLNTDMFCNNSWDSSSSLQVSFSQTSTSSLGTSSVDMNNKHNSKSDWYLQIFNDIKDIVIEHSLVLQIIALTFGVCYCATLACKLNMQRLGFSASTLLISPLTIVYVFLKCGNQMGFDVITLDYSYLCATWDPNSVRYITLAVVLWISVCLLTFYVWFPDSERIAKLERMFIAHLKDCLFVDFNLLLRKRRKHQKRLHKNEGASKHIVPKVYICATMWHENWKEMVQLLKSLLRIDRHCAVSRTAEKNFSVTVEDPDKFEPEIHIIFDDAFCNDEESKEQVPNKYVFQFIDCLDEAALDILGSELKNKWDSTPVKASLPYGGRLTWILPGKTKMVVHLKNKLKIRHRKRWSQVMYLYYLLGFKAFQYKSREEVLRDRKGKKDEDLAPKTFKNVLPDKDKTALENTFILTLDGDVDFKPKAVLLLIDRMKKNSKVGAVCGRIHPIGSGPVVWYQKFEYAVGHWLQKAAEHILGCVLCCPGCFSLFRGSALIDDNVVKTYTKKPTKALHYVQFEQGEDRWLCTLLLQQGYKVDYCAGADAYTFAPESFNEFFIQRRRWSPSTNANIFDLLKSWKHTVRQNANISRLFMAYQGLMLATSLLAPATVSLMITGSYSSVLDLSSWSSYILSIAPIVFFIIVCLKCKQGTQLFFAAILSSIYTIVMIIVTVGTILNVTSENVLSPNVLFLIGLFIIFSVSALWHPKEFGCLLHGLLYYVAVPSTFIFLTIYYICNLNVVTWGTRENKQTQVQTPRSKKKSSKNPLSLLKAVPKKLLKKKRVEKQEQNNEENTQTQSENDNAVIDINENRNDLDSKNELSHKGLHVQNFCNTGWLNLDVFSECKIDKEARYEESFWTQIIQKYLLPIEGNKEHEEKIKTDLLSLRNNIAFAFFMINFMFSIALLQLQVNREKLLKFYFYGKYEPISVIFLSLFSFLLILQFLSMIIHRWGTFQHLISGTRVFSCSNLSDKERFEIHFREASEQIENQEAYHSDTEAFSTPNDDQMLHSRNTRDAVSRQNGNVMNLYELQFTKNFDRTLRLKTRTRKRLNSVIWNASKLAKSRNHKKEYIDRLYQTAD